MNKIKIVSSLTFILFVYAWSVQAQTEVKSFALQKNDFMISLNFGVGSYISTDSPQPDLASYNWSAPMSGWFDKSPILDIEARWLMTNRWVLKLTGGFVFGSNPGYTEVTGTGTDITSGDVPTYEAVPSSKSLQYSIGVGAENYLYAFNSNLYLRIGGEFGLAYGRIDSNAPDSEKYIGTSLGEAYSLRIAPVVGVDYFFGNSLFVGADLRPLDYAYSVYSIRPQVGMKLLSSDNHTFSFISRPMLKVGFKF